MNDYIIDSCGIKRTAIYIECFNCEKQFLKIKKEIKKSSKHFCSKDCFMSYSTKNNKNIFCAWCNKNFTRKESSFKRSKSGLYFCSLLCKNKAQSINGLPEITPKHYGTATKNINKKCLVCGQQTNYKVKYCNEHQKVKPYDKYIKRWKEGLETGNRSDNESLSAHIRRYIFEKYNAKCIKCGWGEVNTKSGKIPLTINHIDGDCTNSKEDNLELICPNCHSLTHNYGALNIGSGRKSRRKQNN